ncbi:MAG: putative thioesterase [Modestobacter sp.]|nr:putative thioesterase [Modestobacter sp.]
MATEGATTADSTTDGGTTAGTAEEAELLAAVTELGAALRELVDVSVATTVDPAELRAAAASAREISARLSASRRGRDQLSVLDDVVQFRRVFNPVSGVGNPLAPPLVVHPVDGGVAAEASLGMAYEGPPSYVHGGMSALLMDQLLGAATTEAGLWGMTARLELDYRRPVPLQAPLLLRAAVSEVAGRRTVITGTIALADAPEQTLVEARAVFVIPRPEKATAYFGRITDASGEAAPPRRPSDAAAVADAD